MKTYFLFQVFFNGWHSDTSSTVFILPDNEAELNRQLEIEQGYLLFIFKTEDYRKDFIIAAKTLSFHTDTFFTRQDLKENEKNKDIIKE